MRKPKRLAGRITSSGLIILLVSLIACGSAPPLVLERIAEVPENVEGILRGPKEKDDLPLSVCSKEQLCYVFFSQDVMRIKKYIAELEVRLKACQKR